MKEKILAPIMAQLNRIERKVSRENSIQYLNINEVSNLTSLSKSTIRRAVKRGKLKPNKRQGKLLFKTTAIERWMNG